MINVDGMFHHTGGALYVLLGVYTSLAFWAFSFSMTYHYLSKINKVKKQSMAIVTQVALGLIFGMFWPVMLAVLNLMGAFALIFIYIHPPMPDEVPEIADLAHLLEGEHQ